MFRTTPRIESPPYCRRRSLRAFTLIELLAVIAIIGVLAALAVGSISKIRESARRSTCSSNLRQIGAAFQLYAAENRGLYPAVRSPNLTTAPSGNPYPVPYTSTNLPPGANPQGDGWQVEISRYIASGTLANGGQTLTQVKNVGAASNIAHCPSYDQLFDANRTLTAQSTISAAGYGMNVNLNLGGSNYYANYQWASIAVRFSAAAISNPARTILVGDSSEYYINYAGSWTAVATHPDGYSNGAPTRHGSNANYLYADGHVSALTADQAAVAATFKL